MEILHDDESVQIRLSQSARCLEVEPKAVGFHRSLARLPELASAHGCRALLVDRRAGIEEKSGNAAMPAWFPALLQRGLRSFAVVRTDDTRFASSDVVMGLSLFGVDYRDFVDLDRARSWIGRQGMESPYPVAEQETWGAS